MKSTNTIFIIDDAPEEIALLLDAVYSIDNSIICFTSHNGINALDFLHNAPLLPHLIIIDIKLPKLNGLTCLSMIKSDDRFGNIPVVMLSDTFSQAELEESKKAGAVDFIKKPENFSDFRKMRSIIKKYMPVPDSL